MPGGRLMRTKESVKTMWVRRLLQPEYPQALELAWQVFMRFDAPDYSPEGVLSFRQTITAPAYVDTVIVYGAFSENRLIGMIAVRNDHTHIALFFVAEAYQHRGVGRALFHEALSHASGAAVTVNSAPYAVETYCKLGFVAIKEEQLTQGIRYTPMRYEG